MVERSGPVRENSLSRPILVFDDDDDVGYIMML